jgi:hypothetical protein
MHNPKKAHRHDLDALMKEAQKDEMFVSVENITVFEWIKYSQQKCCRIVFFIKGLRFSLKTETSPLKLVNPVHLLRV